MRTIPKLTHYRPLRPWNTLTMLVTGCGNGGRTRAMTVSTVMDRTLGSLYIKLSDEPVTTTDELDEIGNVMVDRDASGHIVGLEVVFVYGPIPFDDVYRLLGTEARHLDAALTGLNQAISSSPGSDMIRIA